MPLREGTITGVINIESIYCQIQIWSHGKLWVGRALLVAFVLGLALVASALLLTGAWSKTAPPRASAFLSPVETPTAPVSTPTPRLIRVTTSTPTRTPAATVTATSTQTRTPVPLQPNATQVASPARVTQAPQVTYPTPVPPTPTDPPAPPPPSCPSAPLQGYATDLFNAINGARRANGLGSLSAHGCAVYVAQIRSDDMANLNYFSHTSPSGETAFSLLDAYRIPHGWSGENLARNNYPDEDSVGVAIRDLMASDSHRANILSTNYTTMGVAAAFDGDGMKYFTMVFMGPP